MELCLDKRDDPCRQILPHQEALSRTQTEATVSGSNQSKSWEEASSANQEEPDLRLTVAWALSVTFWQSHLNRDTRQRPRESSHPQLDVNGRLVQERNQRRKQGGGRPEAKPRRRKLWRLASRAHNDKHDWQEQLFTLVYYRHKYQAHEGIKTECDQPLLLPRMPTWRRHKGIAQRVVAWSHGESLVAWVDVIPGERRREADAHA